MHKKTLTMTCQGIKCRQHKFVKHETLSGRSVQQAQARFEEAQEPFGTSATCFIA